MGKGGFSSQNNILENYTCIFFKTEKCISEKFNKFGNFFFYLVLKSVEGKYEN